jgi:hypothetical protein
LNLVSGLFFLIVVIAAMPAPFHVILAIDDVDSFGFPWWTHLGIAVGLAAGVAAVWLPLRAGVRNLRGMEF